MAGNENIRIGVIGASGYTGADLIRLAACHPNIVIKTLTGKSHAGKPLSEVFPHLRTLAAPRLCDVDEVDWKDIDAVFCGLPHGASHELIAGLPEHLKIIDMSADFRLSEPDTYKKWYGAEHKAPELLETAVYGLTEHYAEEISKARLVACPGCYPTAALLALLPLVKNGSIDPLDIIIDAKSGVSGAGRGLKQNTLFSEAGEGLSPYSIAAHRHVAEIEQELGGAAGREIDVNFTPHLVPMSRGELVTCYVKLNSGKSAEDLRQELIDAYDDAYFVRVVDEGIIPATQHVRGSNFCHIAVFEDRIYRRAIIVSTLDNLVKGSAGQALQNFNLMFGLSETAGLTQLPLFP